MNKRMRHRKRKNAWENELDDLIRGICGGFLFGIPLFYTMEVWWIGSFAEPVQRISSLAATFIGVLLLNRTAGFRKSNNIRIKDAAMDSVEAMALGLVCALFTLILLREITFDTPWREILGKVIFEGMPFSIGVGLARSLLSGDRNQAQYDQDAHSQSQKKPEQANFNPTVLDLSATLLGATFLAFNIAPTDEVPMLAAAISPPWLLAIIAASLLISYGIVFQAGFTSENVRRQQKGLFQRPMSETITAYLLSLLAAALLLAFFHTLTFKDPWQLWLSHTLVLGLPATIGGAAGRLMV
ncbi:MAG: TIGR02587 family membrane protein [Microcoleus vaginatus WJT46-NPBG5]|jgi:putative integral membrane protein (TIGR02587 family)|nr:TIGR02587 family membrane protein [Microcoleus vaginatus WJT46-NPBG5]